MCDHIARHADGSNMSSRPVYKGTCAAHMPHLLSPLLRHQVHEGRAKRLQPAKDVGRQHGWSVHQHAALHLKPFRLEQLPVRCVAREIPAIAENIILSRPASPEGSVGRQLRRMRLRMSVIQMTHHGLPALASMPSRASTAVRATRTDRAFPCPPKSATNRPPGLSARLTPCSGAACEIFWSKQTHYHEHCRA